MRRFWNDLKKHNGYALYAARSELKAEVASSYLNWIWWVVEPFCFMMIYTFIFGYVFNAREEYFPVFVFIGITAWDFFTKTVRNSVTMVKKNKAVVSKVYLPKFILIISRMYVNGFKMLINWGIILIMFIVFRVPVTWNILYMIPLLIILWILSFGCGCILLNCGVYIDDLANVISIVLKFAFYLTGIFYNIETRLGGKYPALAHVVGEWNPMAYIIIGLRKAILYGQAPDLVVMLVWSVVAVLLCLFGIRLIYKNENNYVKVI